MASPSGGTDAEQGGLHSTDPVRVSGLSARPELNGLTGQLTRWVPEKQRWGVEVCIGAKKVELLAVRLANLERVTDLRVSDAAADHSTLQEAVDASTFGARIVIGDISARPDLQDAVINKAVTVQIEEGSKNVTLGSLKVSCDVGTTRLHRLTVARGIELQKGTAELHVCVVSNPGGSGILISRGQALLRECTVMRCTDGVLCQSGQLTVDTCVIEKCTDDGIFSNPSFVVRDTISETWDGTASSAEGVTSAKARTTFRVRCGTITRATTRRSPPLSPAGLSPEGAGEGACTEVQPVPTRGRARGAAPPPPPRVSAVTCGRPLILRIQPRLITCSSTPADSPWKTSMSPPATSWDLTRKLRGSPAKRCASSRASSRARCVAVCYPSGGRNERENTRRR